MESCLDIARRAAKGRLTEQEILDAFEREQKIREGLIAAGKTDNLEQRVATVIVREATDAKIAATLARKAAARNIIVREKINADLGSLKAQGLTPRKAVLAKLEGTQRGVAGGRVSAARQSLAYEAKYLGSVMGRVQRERPHVIDLLRDERFDADVTRELYELREGGTPGKTGNTDAQYMAKVLAGALEESRGDLNRFGAQIGKLDGYAGPQVHDDLAMMRVGADRWIKDIIPLLDLNRTFPDATSEAEVSKILGGVYQTIVSGMSGGESPAMRGQRVGPASLAKRLGQHRVLHFTDAEAALAYRDKYGRGSTMGLILSHQRNAARAASSMEMFGPNPESMLNSVLAREKATLRSQLGEGGKADQKILKQIEQLSEAKFQGAIGQITGMTHVPVNPRAATINANIRAGIGMAKLGGSFLSSFPSDTASAAASAMFRGQGFWNGLFKTVGATFEHLGSAKAKEYAYLLGEGFDGLTGHIASPAIADDSLPGWIARRSHDFYKWTGLTGWTDAARGASARVIAAHLGYNVGKGFDRLDLKLQHVLTLNGIDAAKWEVLRQAGYTEANGNRYLMPDSIRNLADDQVKPLVGKVKPEKLTQAITDKRQELEMDLRGYYADETSYSIVETDAASRRMLVGASRPGTPAGEAIRYIMQFKGFPAAFSQRIIGRAVMGGPGRTMAERILNNAPHIGTLIGGMTIAGYMSVVMKDAFRGTWPPRDPFSWKTLGAAMVQGGGLGIYGDFLFSQSSRFGQSIYATTGGPAVGILEDIGRLYYAARNGDAKAAQALDLIIYNTPYVNLFYVRPVLDILFLNALREAVSPGHLAREQSRRRQNYNQSYVLPRTLNELTH